MQLEMNVASPERVMEVFLSSVHVGLVAKSRANSIRSGVETEERMFKRRGNP